MGATEVEVDVERAGGGWVGWGGGWGGVVSQNQYKEQRPVVVVVLTRL